MSDTEEYVRTIDITAQIAKRQAARNAWIKTPAGIAEIKAAVAAKKAAEAEGNDDVPYSRIIYDDDDRYDKDFGDEDWD